MSRKTIINDRYALNGEIDQVVWIKVRTGWLLVQCTPINTPRVLAVLVRHTGGAGTHKWALMNNSARTFLEFDQERSGTNVHFYEASNTLALELINYRLQSAKFLTANLANAMNYVATHTMAQLGLTALPPPSIASREATPISDPQPYAPELEWDEGEWSLL